MKTILILMDSLNRHWLSACGGSGVQTPHMDRLFSRGVVFDNHFSGSLPCMPARRDMMTGRLNFLEAPWGPVEPWDDCLPPLLRSGRGVYSHMITDHYHYFHSGGEGYHTLFDSWEFERGQECDVWHAHLSDQGLPPVQGGKNRRPDAVNRMWMNTQRDEDYPTPRCFMRAMEFLDANHQEDNWHLHLEVFDPHEPFACPDHYRQMYGDSWEGREPFDWPLYAPVTEDTATVDHIRRCYAGVLTMADVWLGKLLDRMDTLDLWKDTTLILTTDHGHLLGEHGYWAKNYMFDYQALSHIPLVICTPETAFSGRRVHALTSTIDLMPTLMECHQTALPPHVQGRSLSHLLAGGDTHHEAVLYGYFGKDVHMFDGRYDYCRQPAPGSVVHHHTAVPRGFTDFIPRERLAAAETGVFLDTTYGIPHYRLCTPCHRHRNAPDGHLLFDMQEDPGQLHPVQDPDLENRCAEKMAHMLRKYGAPACQAERLGLTGL